MRGSRFCIWWKEGRFESVDGKGIYFGSKLEEEYQGQELLVCHWLEENCA